MAKKKKKIEEDSEPVTNRDQFQLVVQNVHLRNISIDSLIRTIRGQKVMVDFDLAMLYGVKNKRLNEQVKRNIERFPDDFMFRLTQEEWHALRSQIATARTSEDEVIARQGVLHGSQPKGYGEWPLRGHRDAGIA